MQWCFDGFSEGSLFYSTHARMTSSTNDVRSYLWPFKYRIKILELFTIAEVKGSQKCIIFSTVMYIISLQEFIAYIDSKGDYLRNFRSSRWLLSPPSHTHNKMSSSYRIVMVENCIEIFPWQGRLPLKKKSRIDPFASFECQTADNCNNNCRWFSSDGRTIKKHICLALKWKRIPLWS